MPRLFLDDKEDYAPVDAEDFLLRDGTTLCSDRSATICLYPQPLLSSIGRMSRLSDLGLANTTRSWLDYDEGDRRGAPRIFGHVVAPTLDVPYRFLDYWWFFANNNYPIGPWWDHRGDWEGVYVAVPPRAGAGFDWVGFDGHGHATRYLPRVLRCASAGGISESAVHEQECGEDARRVNAYAGHGSHATYPRRCGRNLNAGGLVGLHGAILNSSCMQTKNDKGILPEGDFNGKRAFAGNERPATTIKLLPAAASTWPFWRGHWGDPEGASSHPGRGRRACRRASAIR